MNETQYNRTLFVYVLNDVVKCFSADELLGMKPAMLDIGWKHTATLEPAVWIEHLMNNPAERAKQIESLCHRPNAPHELPATKTI